MEQGFDVVAQTWNDSIDPLGDKSAHTGACAMGALR